MSDINVTKEGVLRLLLMANPTKICGTDSSKSIQGIGIWDGTIPQRSLDTGKVPEDWRMANVTAIFKKGEKYKPSNYSLTDLYMLQDARANSHQ